MTLARFTVLAVGSALGFTSCRELVQPAPVPAPPPAKPAAAPVRTARPVAVGQITRMTVADFFVRHQSDQVLTYDARPGFHYQLGHIPGAINLPKNSFTTLKPQREAEIKTALAAGKSIVVYCTDLPCPDAQTVASRLATAGYSSSVLTGGWEAWKESGLTTE